MIKQSKHSYLIRLRHLLLFFLNFPSQKQVIRYAAQSLIIVFAYSAFSLRKIRFRRRTLFSLSLKRRGQNYFVTLFLVMTIISTRLPRAFSPRSDIKSGRVQKRNVCTIKIIINLGAYAHHKLDSC